MIGEYNHRSKKAAIPSLSAKDQHYENKMLIKCLSRTQFLHFYGRILSVKKHIVKDWCWKHYYFFELFLFLYKNNS